MIIAYVPVLHEGYFRFFREYPNEPIWILGSDVTDCFTSLERDLRKVNPGAIKTMLVAFFPNRAIHVASESDLAGLDPSSAIILPDEDISHDLAAKYAWTAATFHSCFLRWDKLPSTAFQTPNAQSIVTLNDFHARVMQRAKDEALHAADWWRQVGAALLKNEEIVATAHNTHLPSDSTLGLFGDPRSNFNAGEQPDVYTSIHGETKIIAECAAQGIATQGTSLFVTTFPCPNCAKAIAIAGISHVFYLDGYSRLDAEQILNDFGVTLARVALPDPTNNANLRIV